MASNLQRFTSSYGKGVLPGVTVERNILAGNLPKQGLLIVVSHVRLYQGLKLKLLRGPNL